MNTDTLPAEVQNTLKLWISRWMADDGHNKLLWNDQAPTPNQVIDLLTAAHDAGVKEGYVKFAGQVEDSLNEFGDQPEQCLAIIAEHCQLAQATPEQQ